MLAVGSQKNCFFEADNATLLFAEPLGVSMPLAHLLHADFLVIAAQTLLGDKKVAFAAGSAVVAGIVAGTLDAGTAKKVAVTCCDSEQRSNTPEPHRAHL